MTMHIGMPEENILQFTRGERSFTREVTSIFAQIFGPIVHHLVTLQNFYDLEMYAWQVEVQFAKLEILRRISGDDRWVVLKEEAAALADFKNIIRTIVRKERARIMRRIGAKRRLRR
jgi:plasmid maintenance system antidote protein VapI